MSTHHSKMKAAQAQTEFPGLTNGGYDVEQSQRVVNAYLNGMTPETRNFNLMPLQVKVDGIMSDGRIGQNAASTQTFAMLVRFTRDALQKLHPGTGPGTYESPMPGVPTGAATKLDDWHHTQDHVLMANMQRLIGYADINKLGLTPEQLKQAHAGNTTGLEGHVPPAVLEQIKKGEIVDGAFGPKSKKAWDAFTHDPQTMKLAHALGEQVGHAPAQAAPVAAVAQAPAQVAALPGSPMHPESHLPPPAAAPLPAGPVAAAAPPPQKVAAAPVVPVKTEPLPTQPEGKLTPVAYASMTDQQRAQIYEQLASQRAALRAATAPSSKGALSTRLQDHEKMSHMTPAEKLAYMQETGRRLEATSQLAGGGQNGSGSITSAMDQVQFAMQNQPTPMFDEGGTAVARYLTQGNAQSLLDLGETPEVKAYHDVVGPLYDQGKLDAFLHDKPMSTKMAPTARSPSVRAGLVPPMG